MSSCQYTNGIAFHQDVHTAPITLMVGRKELVVDATQCIITLKLHEEMGLIAIASFCSVFWNVGRANKNQQLLHPSHTEIRISQC